MRFFGVISVTVVLMAVAPTVSGADVNRLSATAPVRDSINLTIYNGNFALVREVRRMTLPLGVLELEVQDVARTIEPASIAIRDDADGFTVLEQSYRFDLLNKASLLERFIGRKLKYSRTVREENRFEKVLREGILLSINPEVVRFGDEIEIEPEGTISLPYLPDDLKTTPTLIWLLDNQRAGERAVEISYLAGDITWRSDYVLSLAPSGSEGDLQGWITVENHSGLSFEEARVDLIAGEVAGASAPRMLMAESRMAMADAAAGPVASEFGDYRQYSLQRPVSLAQNALKQVELLRLPALKVARRYVSEAQVPVYGGGYAPRQRVRAEIELAPPKDQPLPAGIVRVYQPDLSGAMQFLGEDSISHSSAKVPAVISVGQPNDLSVSRSLVSRRRLGDDGVELTVSIRVTNATREATEVTLREQFPRDWEIAQQSQQGRRDELRQVYQVKVPANGEKTVTYTARVRR